MAADTSDTATLCVILGVHTCAVWVGQYRMAQLMDDNPSYRLGLVRIKPPSDGVTVRGTPYLILDSAADLRYPHAMARIARVVVPGLPHHITQRGNRRQQTFFNDDDYRAYLDLMAHWCAAWQVEIWGYCLMPNHVHLIAVPGSENGLRQAIGEAHRRYSRRINFREGWRGHLWQGRFASFVMDEPYLLAAARYVELNPVRAKLVASPEAYRWSSASAHLSGTDDSLVKTAPLLRLIPDWRTFLASGMDEHDLKKFRRHERTGRPLGDDRFLASVESVVGRTIRPAKPGRKAGQQRQ